MQSELQKYQLIQTITKIENDWVLQQISAFLQKLMQQNSAWGHIVKPLRKKNDFRRTKNEPKLSKTYATRNRFGNSRVSNRRADRRIINAIIEMNY